MASVGSRFPGHVQQFPALYQKAWAKLFKYVRRLTEGMVRRGASIPAAGEGCQQGSGTPQSGRSLDSVELPIDLEAAARLVAFHD